MKSTEITILQKSLNAVKSKEPPRMPEPSTGSGTRQRARDRGKGRNRTSCTPRLRSPLPARMRELGKSLAWLMWKTKDFVLHILFCSFQGYPSKNAPFMDRELLCSKYVRWLLVQWPEGDHRGVYWK